MEFKSEFDNCKRFTNCKINMTEDYINSLLEQNKCNEHNLEYKRFLKYKFLSKYKEKIDTIPKSYGAFCGHRICNLKYWV
jgi:hypothetical protein